MSNDHIFMLAFDHEIEFNDIFVEGAAPTAAESALIRQAKKGIFKGVQRAIDQGVSRENAAILIDELNGSEIALEARKAGIAYSMPVDPPAGGVILPDGWQDRLKKYQPTWAKPLLWYNVEGHKDKNAGQVERAKGLEEWLHSNNQQLLLEILIRPEPHQDAATGGDIIRYKTEILPKLITAAIGEIYAAGIRPDVWKIEGVPTVEGTKAIGEAATATGAKCLVLGGGGDAATVGQWLGLAAATAGYRGFAVGRTIWQQPVVDWKQNRDDESLIEKVAQRYRQLVDAYTGDSLQAEAFQQAQEVSVS